MLVPPHSLRGRLNLASFRAKIEFIFCDNSRFPVMFFMFMIIMFLFILWNHDVLYLLCLGIVNKYTYIHTLLFSNQSLKKNRTTVCLMWHFRFLYCLLSKMKTIGSQFVILERNTCNSVYHFRYRLVLKGPKWYTECQRFRFFSLFQKELLYSTRVLKRIL